jgi:TolB-like protein/DNA-binding winged helix-turn-helix (wHTH) protein/tetratricopeptide (TPR) repeat protein
MDSDFRVGRWVVRPERLCIHVPGRTAHVAPKSMAVLEVLARANGAVVSRNDILDEVWPGAAVTDDVLTHCIVELRKAFDDSAQDPKVIQTIPKKGFRLIAKVAPVEPQPAGSRSSWRYAVAVTVLLLGGATGVWYVGQKSALAPTVDGTTLAVLPFTDLGTSDGQGLFVDALTETLITHLASLDGLEVTGRASSFHFKNRDEDIVAVGELLGVEHILDGTVIRSGTNLKITARLVDVKTGLTVWNKSYEHPFEDRLDVNKQIVESVAASLSIGLGVGDEAKVIGGTDNLAAYDEFLAGKVAFFGPNSDTMVAIGHFEKAVELDPEYALAWAELAKACHFATFNWGEGEPYRLAERRDRAIETALRLAPESPQVVATRAYLKIFQGQYREARRILDELNRHHEGRDISTAAVGADLALKMGNLGDAYREIGILVRRDPLNPLVSNYLSHLYLLLERPDDALAEVERAIERGQVNIFEMSAAGPMALATGRRDEIEKWLRKFIDELSDLWLDPYTFEHGALERLDDRDALLEWLRRFQSRGMGRSFRVVTWAAYLGEDAMALESLRQWPDPWLYWNPLLKRVRQTEEFRQLMIYEGLVEYWREFGWGNFCQPTEGDDFECH